MKTCALKGASAIALLIGMGVGQTAFAQVDQVTPPAAEEPQQRDRVVVTGSRIAVATGEEAPVPVTVVGTEELQVAAQANVADALIEMPALRASTTMSKGGNATSGGSFLNLRSMGPARTLVLLDGKRIVTSSGFGTGNAAVNIDAIPSSLIARVDTVTGGASAAYGSDAVAGVVNFVLDTEYEGLKGEAQVGQTDYGDNLNYKGSLTAGGSFADGRGRMLFSGEYARSLGILGDYYGKDPARPWLDEVSIVGQSGSAPINIIPNGRWSGLPDTGVIWNGPLRGTAFNPDGTPRPYNFGTNLRGDVATGGDGWKMASAANLSTPNIRSAMFGRISYDLDDDTNIYLEAIHAQSTVLGHIGSVQYDTFTGSPNGLPIRRDNAFITPQLGALMDANSLTSISVRKHTQPLDQDIKSSMDRLMLGIDGRINDDWTWEAYYSYGATSGELKWNYNANAEAFFYASDAVRDPNGNIVCRIKLTDASNPCVPHNPFGRTLSEGPGGLSHAERMYLFPETRFFTSNSQEVVEASVSGSLFELPAGTVGMAAGVGYRHEDLDRTTDTRGLSGRLNPYTRAQGLLSYYNQPAVKGALELWEGFAEVQVPLLADLPLIQSLDLNVATRYTEYSTSGGVNTWKAGLVYVPFEGLRLRGTLSRDIRAANIQELFAPPSTGYANVRDPFQGNAFYATIPVPNGNANLQPEEADTKTLGVVYRPDFLPDFFISLDWYNIEIAGQIGALAYQRTVDLCFQGQQTFCSLITRNSAGLIVTIGTPLLNIAQYETSGIDLEMGYEQPLDMFGVAGDLSLRLFATHRIKDETATGGGARPQDSASNQGQEVASLTATYKTGALSLSAQQNYVSGGRLSQTLPRFAGDRIKSQSFLDFTARYDFDTFELFGSVQNVWDRDPPRFPFTQPLTTSNGVFDQLGRRYVVGIRFDL